MPTDKRLKMYVSITIIGLRRNENIIRRRVRQAAPENKRRRRLMPGICVSHISNYHFAFISAAELIPGRRHGHSTAAVIVTLGPKDHIHSTTT